MRKDKYYRHPEFGYVIANEPVVTPEGHACFVNLVAPKGFTAEDGTVGRPRWELCIVLDDNKENRAWLDQIVEMKDEMLEIFNSGGGKKKSSKVNIDDEGVYDTEYDYEKYPHLEDKLVLKCRNSKECPDIIDPQGNSDTLGADAIFNGAVVRAVVRPMITAHGVSYQMNAVQFVEDDGTKYAGGKPDYVSLLSATRPVEDSEEEEDTEQEDAEVEDDQYTEDDSETTDDDDTEEEPALDEDEQEDEQEEEEEEEETPPVRRKSAITSAPLAAKGKTTTKSAPVVAKKGTTTAPVSKLRAKIDREQAALNNRKTLNGLKNKAVIDNAKNKNSLRKSVNKL